MNIKEFLKNSYREECPVWLKDFVPGTSTLSINDFFQSRTVFYPGYGSDGHAIKIFGSSHSAHCFIYVDSFSDRKMLEQVLNSKPNNPHYTGYHSKILGYHSIDRINLNLTSLSEESWTANLSDTGVWAEDYLNIVPYAFIEILERDNNFDDEHGVYRMAILFIGADAHTCYKLLFCENENHRIPFCIFLQDHGFAGNYSVFGEGGVMHKFAKKNKTFPLFMMVANNTYVWSNYILIETSGYEIGGMHANVRRLYKKTSTY